MVDREALQARPAGSQENGNDGRWSQAAGSNGAGHSTANPPDTQLIPIDRLVAGDSPRLEGEDEEHIRALADADVPLPPILVHRASMRVIDGMHRLRAASLSGHQEIEVSFFDGSEMEAFVQAVKANIAHGLPLAAPDREAAACRVIRSHPEWSDRAIAAATGLSSKTVSAARRKIAADLTEASFRVGLDGRIRPLDSRERRRAARELIERNPDASLREVARAVGISPTTVRDVREKMHQDRQSIRSARRGSDEVRGSREVAGASGDGVARESALQNLHKDPSIRYSESGRVFLRWLAARVQGPTGGRELMSGLPPHCAYLVAAIARECANEWLQFAEELE